MNYSFYSSSDSSLFLGKSKIRTFSRVHARESDTNEIKGLNQNQRHITFSSRIGEHCP